jgi:hypothetical protein
VLMSFHSSIQERCRQTLGNVITLSEICNLHVTSEMVDDSFLPPTSHQLILDHDRLPSDSSNGLATIPLRTSMIPSPSVQNDGLTFPHLNSPLIAKMQCKLSVLVLETVSAKSKSTRLPLYCILAKFTRFACPLSSSSAVLSAHSQTLGVAFAGFHAPSVSLDHSADPLRNH